MDTSAWGLTIQLVTGLVIGFLIALTGIGGGALAVPALTLLLGVPASVAVGTASLYAFLTKCYAVFEHNRMGNLDRPAALTFLAGAVPAGIVVAVLVNRYTLEAAADAERIQSLQDLLARVIGVSMLLSVAILAANMFRRIPIEADPETIASPSSVKLPLQVASGALIGSLMGATSVGGGILVFPALIVLFGLSANRAVGTSIVIALLLSLQTAIVYMGGGQIEYGMAVLMSAGSLVGVFFGSRLSVRMPERTLQAVVIALIFIAALLMLL